MSAEAGVIDERAGLADPVVPIIRAARAGDAAAFEELMQLTERRAAQIAWSILGNQEDTKDAVQETFIRLYRHLHRYDETKNFSGWVARIAVNVCKDVLRRRKSQRIFEPLADDAQNASSDIAPDDQLIRRDEAALLGRAIDLLAPKERMALILRDLEGMPTEEVADALGSSVSTVRVQISRARIKLRSLITKLRGGRS
jgi:RNA polymerase sigma-70 factor, ECF subfamily